MQQAPKAKRWNQFTLRTLMLAMLFASIGLSWLAVKLRQAQRQREAVAGIEGQAGLVFYDYQVDESGDIVHNSGPPGPAWLRDLVGDDYFIRVVQVSLGNGGMEHVAALPTIERLNVSYPITDRDLAYLKGLNHLQELDLGGTPVTDAGMKQIEPLAQLRRLSIWGTQVTNEGARRLQESLPNCTIVR